MSDMASKYREAAVRQRLLGDTPSADWSDEQADWHMRHGDCTDGTEADSV